MRKRWSVLAAAVLAAALTPAASAAPAASGSVSVDFDHQIATSSNLMFGLSSWPKLKPEYASTVADAGVTILRSDVYLYDLIPDRETFERPPADWNWNPDGENETTNESDLAAYHDAGLKHMLIIHGFPEWMGTEGAETSWDGDDDSLPITDFDALKESFKQVFAHYQDDVDYFEVANEPDLEMDYDDYAHIYREALAGMNEVSADKPVGPQIASDDGDWYEKLLSDPEIGPDVRFGDWHSYGDDKANANAGRWHDINDEAGRSDLPLFVTEWNFSPDFEQEGSINSDSPQAVSFAGWRLSGMMDAGVTGAMIFGSNDEPDSFDAYRRHPFAFVDSDGTLSPKAATFRLLSKDLGLGRGENKITNTGDDGLTSSCSAVNAAGQRVAWAINDSENPVTADLTLENTGANGDVQLTHYLAAPDNDATAPVKTETATATDGTVSTTMELPPYSVYGVVVG
ncbi:cellulase family glycosylhydrolase [Amycolatopsis jiangsuensis]|uniref:Glycoside hydrolase family 5 domain-containing protein n=1 Tax=Amycolatopsis jiangsuensis TaxID=1181879 RepID=A0A840IXU8_9PSEU|nr:cellulase family glycosylhydrolase [Amycolatopsis jiangsuensis]MBB4686032.1 hypothetical protein [Amycolatopsis jiangsuensis]